MDRRQKRDPADCLADALRGLRGKRRENDDARNGFLVAIQPLVKVFIWSGLRVCNVRLQPADLDDVTAHVNLYLMLRWWRRLCRRRSVSAIGSYLRSTIVGVVRNWVKGLFERPRCGPFDIAPAREADWVAEADERIDGEVVRDEIRREVEEHLRLRGERAEEVRGVVERMARIRVWGKYEQNGAVREVVGRGLPGDDGDVLPERRVG